MSIRRLKDNLFLVIVLAIIVLPIAYVVGFIYRIIIYSYTFFKDKDPAIEKKARYEKAILEIERKAAQAEKYKEIVCRRYISKAEKMQSLDEAFNELKLLIQLKELGEFGEPGEYEEPKEFLKVRFDPVFCKALEYMDINDIDKKRYSKYEYTKNDVQELAFDIFYNAWFAKTCDSPYHNHVGKIELIDSVLSITYRFYSAKYGDKFAKLKTFRISEDSYTYWSEEESYAGDD